MKLFFHDFLGMKNSEKETYVDDLARSTSQGKRSNECEGERERERERERE